MSSPPSLETRAVVAPDRPRRSARHICAAPDHPAMGRSVRRSCPSSCARCGGPARGCRRAYGPRRMNGIRSGGKRRHESCRVAVRVLRGAAPTSPTAASLRRAPPASVCIAPGRTSVSASSMSTYAAADVGSASLRPATSPRSPAWSAPWPPERRVHRLGRPVSPSRRRRRSPRRGRRRARAARRGSAGRPRAPSMLTIMMETRVVRHGPPAVQPPLAGSSARGVEAGRCRWKSRWARSWRCAARDNRCCFVSRLYVCTTVASAK